MFSFIKLFEDFSDSDSWTVVRDAIQSRRPFTIIVFRTKPSYLKAIETSFKEIDYIKQTAVMIIDGKTIRYPSIFFVLDQNQNYEPEIKELYSKFDIKQVVIGEATRHSTYKTVHQAILGTRLSRRLVQTTSNQKTTSRSAEPIIDSLALMAKS